MRTKLSRLSLPLKIGAIAVCAIAILSVAFTIAVGVSLRQNALAEAGARQELNMGVAWQVLGGYGRDFRRDGDRLFVGDQLLNDFNTPVDRIRELVGGTATIFLGDTRVATNVTKPDGSRATGSKLASGPVREALLSAGKPYRGEADILGTPFFVAYDPIRNAAGETVGILYVGIPQAEFMATVGQLQTKLTMLSVVAAVLIGGAMFWIMRRMMTPLKTLARTVAAVAEGETDLVVGGTRSGDEIGQMAKSVETLRLAMVERQRLELEAEGIRVASASSRDRLAAIEGAKAQDLRAFVQGVEASFERLARGDLTVRMDEAVAAEFEPIRHRFNEAVGSLEDAIGSVVGSISSIRTGLGEITAAAGDLSQRTESQAASLEETVAALGEVTGGVNETATSAAGARDAAAGAQANAQKGGAIVAQAVAAMGEIERSSAEIGKIIGVIDEIAFQTNLLALNAGVEAARAGEAGRGFAVVAQEVRGLAQRSAEAAKEIKALIGSAAAQVERGVSLVTASGRSLEEIVAQVGAMNETIAGIAHSAREQAGSLREVSTAADQMDKVTQQNAAMVEETTAAAQSLAGETEELARLTERFRTSAGAGAHRVAVAAPDPASRANAARPAARPRPQMRATSSGGGRSGGGAAAATASRPAADEWEEF